MMKMMFRLAVLLLVVTVFIVIYIVIAPERSEKFIKYYSTDEKKEIAGHVDVEKGEHLKKVKFKISPKLKEWHNKWEKDWNNFLNLKGNKMKELVDFSLSLVNTVTPKVKIKKLKTNADTQNVNGNIKVLPIKRVVQTVTAMSKVVQNDLQSNLSNFNDMKKGINKHRNKITGIKKFTTNDIYTSKNSQSDFVRKDMQTVKSIKIEPDQKPVIAKKKKRKNKSRKKKKKTILIYTGLHKSEEWYNLKKDNIKGYLKKTKCRQQGCRVAYNRDLFNEADAVVFHERNMPSESTLRYLSKHKQRKQQRWIFFTSESPKNTEYGVIPYNGFFNWTMSYKLKSDIYLPYLQYRKLDDSDIRPDPNINYAKSKKHSTAWLVGNCKFGFRMEYAHLLEQYTDIYVGGGCRDDFPKKINCSRSCELKALNDYKFYLAFENGICTDYITEKYWCYLELGLVPVVLGGANYSDPRLVIPGSFIDASKYDNAKDLGMHLNYLDKNDTAYNEYFKWKQKYKIWHPPTGDWPFESYFLCNICDMLYQELPNKVYNFLSDFWSEFLDCEMPEKALKEKMFPENYDWTVRDTAAEEKERQEKAHIPKDFDEE